MLCMLKRDKDVENELLAHYGMITEITHSQWLNYSDRGAESLN